MIIKLAKKWDISLNKSFMIGDGWRDIQAGKAAGCRTIILDRDYNKEVKADFHVTSHEEIVTIIKKIMHYEVH